MMTSRKDYKPFSILFRVNTLDYKRAKSLGKIKGGSNVDGYDVEVFKRFRTFQDLRKFVNYTGQADIYDMRYCGKFVQSDETDQIFIF